VWWIVIVEGAAPVTVAIVIDVEAEVLVSIRYPADPAAATTATIAKIDTDRIGSYRSNLPKVFCPNEVDDASEHQ
jgi:hypothetical protein